MKSFKLVEKIFLMLSTTLLLLAAEVDTGVNYRLVNANSLNVIRVFDEYVTRLTGDVHFFYDDIEFQSDYAEIFDQQKYVTLIGNVLIIQDTLFIQCHESSYSQQTKDLSGKGEVLCREIHTGIESRRVRSDLFNYNRLDGEYILEGNVQGESFTDSLYIKGGYARYNQNTGYGYLLQKPLLYRSSQDSLSLSGEKIEFFESNSKIVASFSVETRNNDIYTQSDYLVYYHKEGKLIYIGEPRFFSDNGDGKADLITVYLEGGALKEILLEGSSRLQFKTESMTEKDNWIISERMNLYYQDNEPREFQAHDDVFSYFIQESNGERKAITNEVSGDNLQILFKEESGIKSLQFKSNVQGKYIFQKK